MDNQEALYRQALGTVANDQGMIAGVKVNLGYCRIVSPIQGRVGLRQVDVGNYVASTQNLVVVTQLQPISVVFSIPEDDIPEVVNDMRGGQPCTRGGLEPRLQQENRDRLSADLRQ